MTSILTANKQASQSNENDLVVIIPAAGIGARMGADKPKQYLTIQNKTILEHTVERLLSHPLITKAVIVLSKDDPFYKNTSLPNRNDVICAIGGKERADSVLSGLKATTASWVLVHDAARPCVRLQDIDLLINHALTHQHGAILATPVRDTMKRANSSDEIAKTENRERLWHALTPQMFNRQSLLNALEKALTQGASITDEASALEYVGGTPLLVQGHADNIKITLPEDLPLATFLLSQQIDSGKTQ